MDDSPSSESKPHHQATWSEIIRVAEQAGAKVEQTQSGYAIVRTVGTMLLHFPLPMNFNPSKPDEVMAPGPLTIYSIERNLDLKLPYYYVL